jgi:hypothetical protein
MDVARDYFRLYAEYIAEIHGSAPRLTPDFKLFMRAWDANSIVLNMLYADSEPIGFQTAYRVTGGMLGQADSYSLGACYTMPAYRANYKMTLYAGKQFVQVLKDNGASQVMVGLEMHNANRWPRLLRAAVQEHTRGFVI